MPKLTDRFLTTFKPAAGRKDRLAFDTECRGVSGGAKVGQWSGATAALRPE